MQERDVTNRFERMARRVCVLGCQPSSFPSMLLMGVDTVYRVLAQTG